MKHVKFWIRIACFVLIFSLLAIKYFELITPKYYTDTWPTTSTLTGFYDLDENTVDVIFLGTSHGVTGFIPQELYNNYGITSYNLSCEQQNLVSSYYWLREALKYQSPKVLVLESYVCFPFLHNEPLNTSEPCTRKAIDSMKWGKNKIDYIKDICALDSSQSIKSFFLPNIRYHDRWEELSFNDYGRDYMMKYAKSMGAWVVPCDDKKSKFEGIDIDEDAEPAYMHPLMEEYLNKINSLCKEYNINLVLALTPTADRLSEHHNALEKYAKESELFFIDFNTKSMFEELDYDFQKNNRDNGHVGIDGAIKISNYLGKELVDRYALQSHYSEQWEQTKDFYVDKCAECRLKSVSDLDEYLDLLDSSLPSIVFVLKGDERNNLNNTTIEKIHNLGIDSNLDIGGKNSFAAIIDEKTVLIEHAGEDGCMADEYVASGMIKASLFCPGTYDNEECSISFDGHEYVKQNIGLNIVVFSNEKREVIDSIWVDVINNPSKIIR